MRKPVMVVAAVMVALMAVVVPLSGQSSPLVGTWTINLAKSTFSPGPPPTSSTIKWERVAGGHRFSVDQVAATGQATHTENIEKDDGTEGRIQGATTPTTRFLRRIDDRNYEDGDNANGKSTVSRKLVISPDGKTITVTMKGTTPQGQPLNNVVVYERQQP